MSALGAGPNGAPVRVMMLLPSLNSGGSERVAINLLRTCDAEAVDLRIGLLRRAGAFLGEVDPAKIVAAPGRQSWLGFEQHNSVFYQPHRLVAGAALAPRNIARMIRAVRPDVLMTFAKGVNVLTSWVLRGMGADRPQWICREDNNTDAVIDDEIAGPRARAFIKAVTRRAYRSADCFLAVANDLAADLQRQLGLDPARMQVIYNPIDVARIERLAAEAPPMTPERPFIVTAGRLDRQKGHDLLVQAFAESRASAEMDLVILGQGGQERALRAQAAALGLGDRVKFPGFQPNPWAWFARARLFVLASRWEGFGNVVAEALACGVPTIVTDCNFGPREQVEHGASGWVVPTESVGALTVAIDTLCGDPALAARLGAAGKIRAQAFDLEVIAKTYTSLFIAQAQMGRSVAAGHAGDLPMGIGEMLGTAEA